MGAYLDKIQEGFSDLDLGIEVTPLLNEALAAGEKAGEILDAMSAGLKKVGELFEKGEYYLADLVYAGDLMKEGVRVIEPHLVGESRPEKGTVILATVEGDIHDIGKNIVASLLSGAGYRVVDLGVDVSPDRVVNAVRESGSRAVGLSVLLTTTIPAAAVVVDAFRAAGMRDGVKIAVGGACTTPGLVETIGVDAVGTDAVSAVNIFERFLGEEGGDST